MKELILLKDLGMVYATKTSKKPKRKGLYKCHCGKEFDANSYDVKSGHTSSCGCIGCNRTHGLSGAKLYWVWTAMKERCLNPNNEWFKNYGSRGIKVCEEWTDFKTFYDWAMSSGYKEGLSIDRRDNDGNYEPSNCRWATVVTQNRNTQRIRRSNTSGYRGVCWDKSRSKFIVTIGIDKKLKYLGRFKTALEGAYAYDNYVTEHNLEHTKNF